MCFISISLRSEAHARIPRRLCTVIGIPPPDTKWTDARKFMAIALPENAFGVAVTLPFDL